MIVHCTLSGVLSEMFALSMSVPCGKCTCNSVSGREWDCDSIP